ncbi:hypothetical protein ACM41_13925 [Bradyrhizobium sp. CCBAU 21362]|nr:hypothetical protein [Bradyrhizobium sp. CCBAU 21362]
MRILSPIVESFVLAMFNVKGHLRPRSAVRTLVRDRHARHRAGGFQELLHEPLSTARVSSALDQDVGNEAILVNSAPEPMLFARDRDNDLVQMPFVTASGSALANPIGERHAEFGSPLAPSFIVHACLARASLFDLARHLHDKRYRRLSNL